LVVGLFTRKKGSMLIRKFFSLLLVLLLLALGTVVNAHEARTVGAYDLELGWRVEPVYTGVINGPEFYVHDHATGAPVTDLESTLHLLVHFGDQEKLLQFYQVENDPGHYTADLIPTRPGDYTFHVFGKINDQDVDELFTSADGYFDSVDPQTDILFPSLDASPEPTAEAGATPEVTSASQQIADLQAQIDQLKAQIQQFQATKTP
jgi:hypothetical protein